MEQLNLGLGFNGLLQNHIMDYISMSVRIKVASYGRRSY